MKDTVAERLFKNGVIARGQCPIEEKVVTHLLKLTGRELKQACWLKLPKQALDLLLAATIDAQTSLGLSRPSTSHKGILEDAFVAYLLNDKMKFKCPGCNQFTLPIAEKGTGRYRNSFCTIACMNACEEVVRRRRGTCKARYGYEEANHNPEIAERRNANVRRVQKEKYEDIQRSKRKTALSNWGVEHHMHHSVFRAETSRRNVALNTSALGRAAYKKRSGFDNPMHDPATLKKMLDTKIARYGTTSSSPHMKGNKGRNNFSSTEMQQAIRTSDGKLKGRVMKQQLTVKVSFRGKGLLVGSGLEASFVKRLEENKNIKAVVQGDKLPTISVGTKRYFPDLGLISTSGKKALVEVKSPFTFKAEGSKVIACALAAVKVAKKHQAVYVMAVCEGKNEWKTMVNPTKAQLVNYLVSIM